MLLVRLLSSATVPIQLLVIVPVGDMYQLFCILEKIKVFILVATSSLKADSTPCLIFKSLEVVTF